MSATPFQEIEARPATRRSPARTLRRLVASTVAYASLLALGVTMMIPLFWMLSTAVKRDESEFLMPPEWIPNPILWSNFVDALTYAPFDLFLRNTLTIALFATLGTLVTASMAAYGFARLKFPGRDFFFAVLLATMMLPSIVTLIPTFIVFKELHWIDTFLPLIVPSWFGGGAFSIFLLRQFFMTVPYELEEAARIDGASGLRIWATLMIPLALPALAAVGIFSFLHHWNDFMGPLVYIRSMDNRTVALGLQQFLTNIGMRWNWMMAASTAMTLPIIVLFFAAQRYFIRGIVTSGFGGR